MIFYRYVNKLHFSSLQNIIFWFDLKMCKCLPGNYVGSIKPHLCNWSIRRKDKNLMPFFLLLFNTLVTIVLYFLKSKTVLTTLQRIQDIWHGPYSCHGHYIFMFDSKSLIWCFIIGIIKVMQECDILMQQESFINIKEMRYIDCHGLYINLAEF